MDLLILPKRKFLVDICQYKEVQFLRLVLNLEYRMANYLVFPKYNAIIFINGCFWHGHDCHLFKYPATQKEFWNEKLNKTKETDAQNISLLMKDGWRVLKIWECSLKGIEKIGLEEVISHTTAWLVSDNNFLEIRGIARN